MGDLGWRAQSSQLSREAKPIEGLRADFGLRVKSVLESMKEEGDPGSVREARGGQGVLFKGQNKGVADRAKRDFEQLETDEGKEVKRLAALERKALLYDRLQHGVDLDNEEANDRHEVDFIAKALSDDATICRDGGRNPLAMPLHPESIIERQQAIRRQMQGGSQQEYSTYEEDVEELQARHRNVDELNELNAKRNADFKEARQKDAEKEARKQRENAKHKNAVLQRLLQKRQKLKS